MTATALLRACPQRNGCPLVRPHDLRRMDLAPRLKTVLLAAGASVILHLGAMAALSPRDAALIAGGGEDAPAALGTSFADFTEGVASPSQAEPLEAQEMNALLPENPVHPVPSQAPQAEAPAIALPMAPDPGAALLPAAPDTPPPAEIATMPEVALATRSQRAPPPAHSMPPTPVQDLAVAHTAEVISPDASPTDLAPTASAKPPPRPDRTAPTQPTRQARAPQGNAAQNATRGSQQGSTGQAVSQDQSRAQASAQGNAAVSNYPGEVMRRIQRTRLARSPARGQVLVAFSIGANGGLAAASVARSSGHAALDRTALDHIRRAAPFPPPPAGAQRQFSFEFVGR
ncbi:TonB family protein [Roseinatronobacter sp.]